MFAIPFTILIVVNSMVILAIHRSRQVHAKLNVYDDGTRKQELAKEISTSIMLVAIVLAFLLCNTLVGVLDELRVDWEKFSMFYYFKFILFQGFIVNIMEKLELYDLYVKFVPFSNMLVMANASINICIYCMFSDRYRHLFWYYLQFLRCDKKADTNFQIISSNFWEGKVGSFWIRKKCLL